MNCTRCLDSRPIGLAFCPGCGEPFFGALASPAPFAGEAPTRRMPGPASLQPLPPRVAVAPAVSVGPRQGPRVSPASREVSLLLALVPLLAFGIGGIHRFYTGRIGSGIVQLLTGGGFLIWAAVDVLRLCQNRFRDADERLVLSRGPSPDRWAWPSRATPQAAEAYHSIPVRG